MYFRLFHPNAPTLFMLSKIMMSNKAVLSPKAYSNRALYQNPICKTVCSDDRAISYTISHRMMKWIPKNQYEFPNTFAWTLKGIRHHWESIPIFISVGFALCLVAGITIWACLHKEALVFKGCYQNNSLSRTMDLRNPKVHKLMVVCDYEPWPEMQDVLDAMKAVEELQEFQACDCDKCAHADDDDEDCDEY